MHLTLVYFIHIACNHNKSYNKIPNLNQNKIPVITFAQRYQIINNKISRMLKNFNIYKKYAVK